MMWWAVGVAFVLGVVVGAVALTRRREKAAAAEGHSPTDWAHAMDLTCRAHDALAGCLVASDGDVLAVALAPGASPEMLERAAAGARMALGDGRAQPHTVRELVAVSDEDLGAAVVFGREPPPAQAAAVAADLRRLASGYRAAREGRDLGRPTTWDPMLPALDSLESVTFALCESARQLTNRATAVVLRDPNSQVPMVIAVSHGGDRRLIGLVVPPECAAARAARGRHPVVGKTAAELLGESPTDRRRGEDEGTAYPLRDAREGAGALIVFGAHDGLDAKVREQLARLALAAGPRLAAAAAVRAAEARALTDELTGLQNRRGLKRAMAAPGVRNGAFLAVDLDHFKRVNDELGHAAGDAVLRHVGRVLVQALREGDVAARTGGEEFALWLPAAGMTVALEVAERVRRTVEETPLVWEGRAVPLTCSIGVAAVPGSATQTSNLSSLADAALYRAKHGGRNRVEAASPGAHAGGSR